MQIIITKTNKSMKNFISFLTRLCSPRVGSQSSDFSLHRRLTVGSPSVRCVSTNSARTAREGLKYAAMLVLLFTLAVGQMWGAVTSTYTFSTDDNSKTITNNGVQWGLGASSVATNGTSLYLGGTITITMPTGAYLYSAKINKSSNWAAANKVTVLLKSGSTTLQTFSVSNYSSAYVLSGNQTDGSYTIEKGLTNKNAWITSIQLVYYPQTVITLNANGGAANKSAKYNYSSGTAAAFTACTRDGYTCTGYYTASSSGTKILNADGTLAAASISSYTDSGKKWIYDGAALTLYAQWESAAACTATPSIGAASLNGSVF